MPQEMHGRRIPVPADGSLPTLEKAGDYCGPVLNLVEGKQVVYYLLPVARDIGVDSNARAIHHVTCPPHKFTEESDGSLTLRDSIGAMPHWHGFLTEGQWELKPSK